MQYPSGQRHILWLCCCAQLGKNQPQSIGMLRLNTGLAARLKESLQSLVPDKKPNARLHARAAFGVGLQAVVRWHALRFRPTWRVCSRPIVLKNSIALPGRTSHRKVDRSECATSDASGPGKGSTTPRNQSKASAEEFFNRIGHKQSSRESHNRTGATSACTELSRTRPRARRQRACLHSNASSTPSEKSSTMCARTRRSSSKRPPACTVGRPGRCPTSCRRWCIPIASRCAT